MFRPVKPSMAEFSHCRVGYEKLGVGNGFAFSSGKTEFWRMDENVGTDSCISSSRLSF